MSGLYHDNSRYCYPGSDVLINIPGLRDQKQLDAFERMVSADRLRMLELKPLKGNFDLKHLCEIHKFIFKDIYPFAGELRNEDISKGNYRFAHFRFIALQTNLLLDELKRENFLQGLPADVFANRLAHYLTEFNVLHPFREGNGRVQREFARCLALKAGYVINWSDVDPGRMLEVMIQSLHDNSALIDTLKVIVKK